jgi:hypothetical protein
MTALQGAWLTAATDAPTIRACHEALPRDPSLSGHSPGLFEGMLRAGDRLFPGLRWLKLEDALGVAGLVPLVHVHEVNRTLGLQALGSVTRFQMTYLEAQVADRVQPHALLHAILATPDEHGRRGDVLRLRDLSPRSPLAAVAQLAPARSRSSAQGASMLDTRRGYEEWLGAQSRNLRGQLRKSSSRMAALGEPVVQVAQSPADVSGAFGRFLELEAAGYKGASDALRHHEADRQVLETALQVHAATGSALARELWVGDRLVASQIGFRQGGRVFLVKVAFDETVSQASPGTFFMANLIESCCNDPEISTIDCLVPQSWHARWHMESESAVSATLPNPLTGRGRMLAIARSSRAWIQSLRRASAPADRT